MIPWTGYCIGLAVPYCLGIDWRQVKTIGIETGIQNVGIAFFIITANFPSPASDFAVLPLVSIALLTPIPLNLLYLILKAHKYIYKPIANRQPENSQSGTFVLVVDFDEQR